MRLRRWTGTQGIRSRGVALWVTLSALIVFEHLVIAGGGGSSPAPWWYPALSIVALAVAVRVRRSQPLLALTIAAGLTMLQLLHGLSEDAPFPVSYIVAVTVLSWLAGRWSDTGRGLAAVLIFGNLLLLALGLPLRGEMLASEAILTWLLNVFWSLLFVLLPWLLGRYRGQQALLASAGWERAERMEHEQQLLVDQARLRERTRIAQDMHDSLGHELSLIALRAGALEVAPDLATQHRTAAGELRHSAATATERLGEIIGVLREQDSRAPLQPAGESIHALVERAVDSGVDVRLVTEGSAATTPPMVQHAAHRVVQEALTNGSKHAPGAPVTVRVRTTPAETRVLVTNGPGAGATPSGSSGGHGIPGLRERVRLLGGSLTTGPSDDGGFEVVATLPHDEAAAPATPASTSESAAELATARRRARRGLVVAVAAPLGIGAAVGVLILAYYLVLGYSAVLDPADYEELRIGQQRAEIEPVLPPLQMIDDPSDSDVPKPAGATCEFYRPDGPFSISFAYRLCFVDGRLAAKDTIQTGSVPVDPEGP